jgi:hypothetical protein
MEQIQHFFEKMPKIVAKSKYMTQGGQIKDVTIEGIDNFF